MGAQNWGKKMGIRPGFFFWHAHVFLFFFMGAEPMDRSCVFLNVHFFYIIYIDWANFFYRHFWYGAASTRGRGDTWTPGFSYENNAPMVRPCFFLLLLPIFSEKKLWADFFRAHFPPMFFFTPMFRLSLTVVFYFFLNSGKKTATRLDPREILWSR